jgi:hypothetical protein
MSVAFERFRGHARNRNLKLFDVARAVIDGTISVDALSLSPSPRPRRP